MNEIPDLQVQLLQLQNLLNGAGNDPIIVPQVRARIDRLQEQLRQLTTVPGELLSKEPVRVPRFAIFIGGSPVEPADPTSLLKPPEWHSRASGEEWEWISGIYGYYVSLRHTGQWRATMYFAGSISEIEMCESADAAKAVCWEHFRAAIRECFQ